MSLMTYRVFIDQLYNIYLKYHRGLIYLEFFDRIGKLLLLFEFSENFALLIYQRNDIFLLHSNYILVFLYDDCSFYTPLYPVGLLV